MAEQPDIQCIYVLRLTKCVMKRSRFHLKDSGIVYCPDKFGVRSSTHQAPSTPVSESRFRKRRNFYAPRDAPSSERPTNTALVIDSTNCHFDKSNAPSTNHNDNYMPNQDQIEMLELNKVRIMAHAIPVVSIFSLWKKALMT